MITLMLVSVVASAEPTTGRERPATAMALAEVLAVAVRQSPTLKRAVVDVEAARAAELAALGPEDFTLSANVRVQREPTFQTQGFPGVIDQRMFGGGLGVSRGLPTGGLLGITGSVGLYDESFRPNGMAAVDVAYRIARLEASLFHPLLRGFGTRIARADRRRARVAKDVATLEESADALALVRDVVIAYWRLAYARQVVAIREEGLRLASEQLRITKNAVRTGSISPNETLGAEQAIAVREGALLTAQVEVSQQSLELRRRVGLEIGKTTIDLAPSTPLVASTRSFDVDDTIARAQANNPLLAILAARGRGAAIDVEVADDATLPRLDLRASAGAATIGSKTTSAIRDLGSFDQPTYAITLELEKPFGSSAARGARGRAEAERRRVRIDLEEARRELVVSTAHALDLLRAAQQRIAVADRSVALAKRTLEVVQTRFINGKATNFDVVLRQDELQQASVSRVLAVSDALAAEATVLALTGDLLEHHHLEIR